MKLPSKSLERTLLTQGHSHVIGVDEVGMGCLAGPVVVCALVCSPIFFTKRHPRLAGLRDSKMLQPHQREQFAAVLQNDPLVQYALSVVDPPEIDALNIFQAARMGMRRALRHLSITAADHPMVLVDGNKKIDDIPWEQRAIVKGDQKIFSIAAASVIAKVHRDALMAHYAQQYPAYAFEVHKGYATALHRARIAQHGLCRLHRTSFRL